MCSQIFREWVYKRAHSRCVFTAHAQVRAKLQGDQLSVRANIGPARLAQRYCVDRRMRLAQDLVYHERSKHISDATIFLPRLQLDF